MATESERRLRKAILKQLVEDRRRYEPNLADKVIDEAFEDFDRFSAKEFSSLIDNVGEQFYSLSTSAGDGLTCNVYTLVETFCGKTRIKTIIAHVECASVVIYLAEYGEEGLNFDVEDFVPVRASLPVLLPADEIRERYARIAVRLKNGEITEKEFDEEAAKIVGWPTV